LEKIMQGLMLHCGAKQITREQIKFLPVPQPLGSRHVTRPFIDDIETIGDMLAQIGMPVVSEGYGVTRDEETKMPKQFFGLMEIDAGHDGRDHGVMVGLRGSYDQTLSRGIAIGSRVFVCDNLCFSGEIEIKTKQTTDIDTRIRSLLFDAIQEVPEMVGHQDRRFENYRNTEIGQIVGDSMIMDMVRAGVLNPSHVGKTVQEWDKPTHAEHAEDGFTLWRLHNAVTEALKPSNRNTNALQRNWDRTIGLTRILDNRVITVN
jgi:hypothetical protein